MEKKAQKKDRGYLGILLIKGGDRTLYDRFLQEVASDPELDQSKLVRLALKEYFDKKDSQLITQ